MRLAIFGLLFFGVVAAVCAALLVASLQVKARPSINSGKVQFLVASQALPRGKILDPDSIAEKILPGKEVPEGVLTNPVQVIGKVLAIPMVEGQAFSGSCFASEGSGYRVASILPHGMRAVTLALTDSSGLSGILYAGCTVDVVSTFCVGTMRNEALATPLLQGVQVLAVAGETLVSGQQSPEGGKKGQDSSFRKILVTLMVDMEQAATLQLATQYGNVSLALRNPMDKTSGVKKQVLLSQFTRGGGSMPASPASVGQLRGLSNSLASAFQGTIRKTAELPKTANAQPKESPPPGVESWKVTIYRGTERSTESIPLREEGGEPEDGAEPEGELSR